MKQIFRETTILHRVRVIILVVLCCLGTGVKTYSQTINTVAGNGLMGYSGDGGAATAASIGYAGGVCASGGYIYIADASNNVIRMVDLTGVITTIAGTGLAGYTGDGGPATAATLNNPNYVAADGAGNIFIADENNHSIRLIDASGTISTITGNGLPGYTGDGAAATAAQLSFPTSVAVDPWGNIYIADNGNQCIRMISAADGNISTIAGTGLAGNTGDGGAATAALLNAPYGLALDGANNLYISDAGNFCVRMIDGSGVINTVAGNNGAAGNGGDGGAATAAYLQNPLSLAYDYAAGNLLIADQGDNKIRIVDASGVINTYAGTGTAGYTGDGGAATAATLNQPAGIAVDNSGLVVIADASNYVVRTIGGGGAMIPLTGAISVCVGQSAVVSGGAGSSATDTWSASTGAITVTSPGASTTITGVTAGTVVLSYFVGSVLTATRTITVFPQPTFAVTSANPNVYCGTPLTLSVSAATGGAGTYTYAWAGAGLSGSAPRTRTCSGITATTTYNITVTDSRGCSRTISSTIIVPACSGAICPLTAGHYLGAGGVIAGGTTYGVSTGAPQIYYIDDGNPASMASVIHITHSCTFQNVVVYVASSRKLEVDPGVQVTLDNAHFLVCGPFLWYGFKLDYTTSGGQATFISQNNTVIEDANPGVDVTNANTAYSSGNIISIDKTIFNRCKVGVNIANFAVSSTTYPFLLGAVAFVGRDLGGYYSAGSGLTYPNAWPTVSDLLYGYSSSTNVRPSLNIDNPAGKPTSSSTFGPYLRVNNIDGNRAWAGIMLNSFGATVAGPTYNGLTLGATANQPLLFDNLTYGINSTFSNLSVSSCYFMYIYPAFVTAVTTASGPDGSGIFADNPLTSSATGLALQKSVTVDASTGPNYFYNCTWGIRAHNLQKIRIDGNSIFSDHTTVNPVTTPNGNVGIHIVDMTNLLSYSGIDVTNNYIVNQVTGLYYSAPDDNTSYTININNNQLTSATSTWGNGGLPGNGYMMNGVIMQTAATATGGTSTGATNVNNNTMAAVYNGIRMTNFPRRTANNNNNIIGMVSDYMSPVGTDQYGIQQATCRNSIANTNYVWYNYAQAPSNKVTGIYSQNNTNNTANCNYVSGFYRAFNFTQNNTAVWLRNVMANTQNWSGYPASADYYLNGTIGQQPAGWVTASDNQFTAGAVNTYTDGTSNSVASRLKVRPGGAMPYYPATNAGFSLSFPYVITPLSVIPTGTATTRCAPTATTQPMTLGRGTGEEYTATDSSSSDSMAPCPQVQWMAQMANWEAYLADSTLMDSSLYSPEAWHQFGQMASHSRYKWLTDIANLLNAGNASAALSLMDADIDAYTNTTSDDATGITMADGSAADGIVANYLKYYRIFAHSLSSELSESEAGELHDLAHGCTNRDGAVLIKARVLNAVINGDAGNISDDCHPCEVYRRGQSNSAVIVADQRFSLFPNPNNGRISIEQSAGNTGAIQAEVYNAVGSLIMSADLNFNGRVAQLQLGNVPAGLYLMTLRDANGKEFHFKFVVE